MRDSMRAGSHSFVKIGDIVFAIVENLSRLNQSAVNDKPALSGAGRATASAGEHRQAREKAGLCMSSREGGPQ
jgi:Mrp family chromosome partitioning ATPase